MNQEQRDTLTREYALVTAYKELHSTIGWVDMVKFLEVKYNKCIKEATDLRAKDENKLKKLTMAGVYKEILDRPGIILKREERIVNELKA